jgi:predicted alpha/beta superfamily hydrolase
MIFRLISLFCLPVLWSVPAAQAQTVQYEISRSAVWSVTDSQSGREYDIYVRTPLDYDEARAEGYPVVYLNDGPYTFLVAAGVAHLPMNAGVMESAIIVGISHARNENGMDSRVRDLTHAHDAGWRLQTGGAAAYADFLETGIIAEVEARYNADPARRILSGQSLGGSFGAWMLVARPGVFSGYILTSPSLWFNDGSIFALEADYAANHTDLPARVYLATGAREVPGDSTRHDLAGDQVRFASMLEGRAYPSLVIRSEIIEGARHETTFPIGFTRGLEWLLAN